MSGIRVERTGGLVEVVLAAAPLNLFTAALTEELRDVLRDLPGDARAVMLRAEGKVFCGGVDVHWFQESTDPAGGAALMASLLDLTQRLEALPVPTVAVVHGLNLTIGLELALCCDLMWAADDARMGLVEATVGLTPGAGGTQRLVGRCGAARAADMVMTGRIVPAAELHAWGVVNQLRPAGVLLEEARAYCLALSEGATYAMALGKRLVREARDRGIAAADAITPEVAGLPFGTHDLTHGVESLLEHGPGKARFIGS